MNWTWVSKLKLPQNIIHLLWLTLHGSLPTNVFRVYRHMSIHAFCNRCGNAHETIYHLLRDCDHSTQVWQHLKLDKPSNFYTSNVFDWLVNNLKGPNGILFAITIWILWKSRNATIFHDQLWDLWQIVSQIQSFFADIMKAFNHPRQHQQCQQVRWETPTFLATKINIDGNSFGNPRRMNFGGLFRDHMGN